MKVGPYTFEESNVDKVLYPDSDITKGDVMEYFIKISEVMLPHVKDRPMAMHRFPNGIDGKDFFQKDTPEYFPEWIDTVKVERKNSDPISMVNIKKSATLAYLANQAVLASHVFLSKADSLHEPDKILFDLDPGENEFTLVIEAAKELHRVLEQRGFSAFVMTSGSSGLHIVVPLQPGHSFEESRNFAREVSDEVVRSQKDSFTTEIRKESRNGRLFIDFTRNSYGQHSIAPYSLRAISRAPVATPLDWDELTSLQEGARTYHIKNILSRLGQKKDPWSEFNQNRHHLDTS